MANKIFDFDVNKPYCGVCGAQGVPLRKLPYRGCDDDQHVCKDREACKARFKAQLKARMG